VTEHNTFDNVAKWTATALLIAGTACINTEYVLAGRLALFVGGLIWLVVSIRWREPALIATNMCMTLAAVAASLYKYSTTGVI
jgi:hypothetical protein